MLFNFGIKTEGKTFSPPLESSLIERASSDSDICWRIYDLQEISYVSEEAVLHLSLKNIMKNSKMFIFSM